MDEFLATYLVIELFHMLYFQDVLAAINNASTHYIYRGHKNNVLEFSRMDELRSVFLVNGVVKSLKISNSRVPILCYDGLHSS